jgi:hypothetical protein
LNTSISLYLNIYGIAALNQTINLCDLLAGVLCPLPQVNFTGFGTYPIPSSFTSKIPSIAYSVPNIEAYARVELLNVDTGEVAACLQATLSNGWTTRWSAVSWATGMFTLVALLIALFHTAAANSPSPAQYRFFDILYLFQSAAASGLLHVNYPSVYTNFVQNFHWALALFDSDAMQSSINKMRAKTGGKLTGTAYNEIQYINRRLSPYNSVFDVNQVANSPNEFLNFIQTSQPVIDRTPKVIDVVAMATIPTVTDVNASSIDTGLPVYVNSLGIPEANAFDTVFFFFLALIGVAVAFHVLFFLLVFLLDRFGKERRGTAWASRLRPMWWDFCAGNALRVVSLRQQGNPASY